MLKEQIVACLKKNEVVHEEFRVGARFGHFLVRRSDLRAVPYEGEAGSKSLLEYLVRDGWQALYDGHSLIGARRENASVRLLPGGQMEFSEEKTDSLKEIDRAYLEFLQALGSELESRGQLLLSIGYQPRSSAGEIPPAPGARSARLLAAIEGDPAALQLVKGAARTTVILDYAHSDDLEKKYRVASVLTPVLAALFDNTPVVDGADCAGYTAGLAMHDAMRTNLGRVEHVITGHSFKYAQYASFVAEAPALADPGRSNEDLYDDAALSEAEVAALLREVLPEVKITADGLELCMVDALPYPLNMAYVALVKGLFYNVDNLNALYEFIMNLSSDLQEHLRQNVAADGMAAKFNEGDVREVCKDLYFMATPQLPKGEQHYTQPLDAILFKNICPKEITRRQLAAMQGK